MKRYLKLWYLYSLYSTQIGLQSRFGVVLFLIGKFLKFGMFFFFIYILSSSVKDIAGYSFWQIIFVFSTFNLIDIIAQIFLREVYRFRSYVVSGNMDYLLVRPVVPLFRFLFGGADILDLPVFFVSFGLLIFSFFKIGGADISGIIIYISLIANALLIALAFHIFVLSIGILTTEVDNSLWLYRDLVSMGKIPVTFYTQPVQSVITYIIPIGIMITFPAEAIFGTLKSQLILISFAVGFLFMLVALLSWRFAIKRYSSASS